MKIGDGSIRYFNICLIFFLQFRGRSIRVIDTPRVFDTNFLNEKVLLELAKTLETFPNGIHAFIYVLNSAHRRFTGEEQIALHTIKVNV